MFGVCKENLDRTQYNAESELTDFPWKKNILYSLEKIKNTKWPDYNKFGSNINFDGADEFKKITVQHWFDKNNVENHPNSNYCF
jgi:DNA (cytosine-5)-methyltransferase 1